MAKTALNEFFMLLLNRRKKRNMHCDRSLLYCVSIDGFVHKFVHLLRIFVPCSCVFFCFVTVNSCFSFFPSIFIFEPIRRLHWNAKLIISNLQCSFVMMVVVWRQQVLSLVPCNFNFGRNEYHFRFQFHLISNFQPAHIWWCVLPKTMHFNRF